MVIIFSYFLYGVEQMQKWDIKVWIKDEILGWKKSIEQFIFMLVDKYLVRECVWGCKGIFILESKSLGVLQVCF